jgi:alkaline phosphatase D
MRRLGLLVCLALATPALADEAKPLSRIAFGSCVHQDKPQPIWGSINALKPELWVFLGDTIYADTEDIDLMRKKYAQLAEQEEYQKLRKSCPILATWDDHDYGGDDAGADYKKKKESQEAFLDFFGVPKDSPRRKREGVYHAEVFGPPGKRVQVIMLDMRYHRSPIKKDPKLPRAGGQYLPNTDEDATILGKEQWKWLEEQLKAPAEVRLLGSSVQLIANEHRHEKWGNFPKEVERLYDLIRRVKANGVIVLSGDRHLAELSMADVGVGYPIYDVTSSGLNQANRFFRRIEPNRHRLAIMDQGNNFGLVRIDWSKEDPLISLEVHDEEGDVMIRHKIPLSRLTVKDSKVASGKNLAAEAAKHVGKEWTVEYTVAAVGANKTKSLYYLNSEKDFRSEANFNAVLDMKALAADLKAAGVTNPPKHYVGKKVKVTGTVTLFNDRPQIMVKSLKQVQVIE